MRNILVILVMVLAFGLMGPGHLSAEGNDTEGGDTESSTKSSEITEQDTPADDTAEIETNADSDEVTTQSTKTDDTKETETNTDSDEVTTQSTKTDDTKETETNTDGDEVAPKSTKIDDTKETETNTDSDKVTTQSTKSNDTDGSEDSSNNSNQEESLDQEEDSVTSKNEEEKSSAKISTTSEEKIIESSISRLGHIRYEGKVYSNLKDLSDYEEAADKYTNQVYYIKKQAEKSGEKFYLISKQPSSLDGVVGWVKAKEMVTYSHTSVDHDNKTFYVKGSGSAYSKAWGGSEDLVYKDLSTYRYQAFKVNLTEKVGNNVWYRGTINGKTAWVHSSYVTEEAKRIISNTSKLGHIRYKGKIYSELNDQSSYKKAAGTYTNQVYYIKKQAKINGEKFYLISKQPSSVKGVVGWVEAKDMVTYSHTTANHDNKTFYVKGSGSAYSKAWGGSKDLVYDNLSKHKYNAFKVNLTEKVGNNVWYRGTLNGKTAWMHSSYVTTKKETSTSRLGHIRYDGKIYTDLHNQSSYKKAAGTYTNQVYYIKRQSVINGNRYYLISKQPSSKKGVVGWVESKDMVTYSHTTASHDNKTFYVKGTGSAYSKAWGGSKDLVYEDLSNHKYSTFKVNLTEKVGNNVWYRGTLNGKTAWMHSSYVVTKETSNTSRLGHIRYDGKIYPDLHNQSSYKKAAGTYTNQVYYIKRQAVINGERFYLISKSPSRVEKVVGWVRSRDMVTLSHKGVNHDSKTLYVKGNGNAYSKAWGGSKDLVYNLSNFGGDRFKINLTEKVGNNIWYRGTLNGRTAWIHESYLGEQNYTNYNLTLDEAVAIQSKARPKTDNDYAYVSKDYIKNGKVDVDTSLNVRMGPGTNYDEIGSLSDGQSVNIIREENGWYVIEHKDNTQWVIANSSDLRYYLDPNNFIHDKKQKFQFLDLSKSSNASVSVLNNYLEGKGVLSGKGQAFIDAGRNNGISDVYLVSHASLETGNGTSKLARGVTYNGKTVYNMYGIGAYDDSALESGAKKAYEEGWFTPYKAIVGGAKFIGNDYIKEGQNTLYKMRWDPEAMASTGSYGHQYATDVGWASKQIYTMYNLYQDLESYKLNLDIPVY